MLLSLWKRWREAPDEGRHAAQAFIIQNASWRMTVSATRSGWLVQTHVEQRPLTETRQRLGTGQHAPTAGCLEALDRLETSGKRFANIADRCRAPSRAM